MASQPETDTPARKVRFPALPHGNIKLRESVNNHWRAIVPRGTPVERLLDSDLWVIRSAEFTPFDRIDVIDEGRTYYVQLLVIEAGQGFCHVIQIAHTALPTQLAIAGTTLPANHIIEHCGPADLWTVRRVSDSVILGKNFPSHAEALAFLLDHASLR